MLSVIESVTGRIREILDERVFVLAQAAQRHFQTNYLIVALDCKDEEPQLEVLPEQGLADARELSLDIQLCFVRLSPDFMDSLMRLNSLSGFRSFARMSQ